LRSTIIWALLFAAGAGSAVGAPQLPAYGGADAGSLVLSMSGSDDPYNWRHTLCLRSDDGRGVRAIDFFLQAGKPSNRTGDFISTPLDPQTAPPLTDGARYSSARMIGVVKVVALQPGRYTIFWLDPVKDCNAPAAGGSGVGLDLSFEIKAGSGLYLGDIFSVEVFRSMAKVLNPFHWQDPIRTRIAFRFEADRDLELAPSSILASGRWT
jgi:hypothetical protein